MKKQNPTYRWRRRRKGERGKPIEQGWGKSVWPTLEGEELCEGLMEKAIQSARLG